VIWSEGAIYFIGLREGLTKWKPLLSAKGYIVVTEPCWLKYDIPDALREFWREYPGMTTVENCSQIIGEAGYREIGHFTLPEAAWWDDYYGPLERKLPTLRHKYQHNPTVLTVIAETQTEIDTYRKYSNSYGYVCFVMQRAA
jgi:hypothetical protein